jgi:hypothetical protein
VGEVTPTPEDCATATDEDCDGLAPPCKGKPLWSERAGDVADQYGFAVAVDLGGNVLVTGQYDGVMDFGGCSLSKMAGTGLFVAKLDPSGACLWSKSAGATGNQYGHDVAVDGAGNVLVTGDFTGALDFGGCPLSKGLGTGLFVAKLDPSGACLWSKNAGAAGSQHGWGAAVDGAGNVLVTGEFTSAMDFGGCPLSKATGHGLFLAKLDPSGTCVWSKSGGATGKQSSYDVAIDGPGNALITGEFASTLDLGGCPLSNSGASGLFVAKVDPSGACLWSKAAGDSTSGNSVAVDSSGNVLLTGSYSGALDMGGCPLSKPDGSGFFVAKLDPAGACVWSKGAAADMGNQYGRAVAVDGTDNVLVTGSFDGVVDFGGGSFVSAGKDFFVVKLDAGGDHQWSRRAGGPLDDTGNGVAVDSVGNVVVTGAFNGTADFGTGPLVSPGGADIFVAKYGP